INSKVKKVKSEEDILLEILDEELNTDGAIIDSVSKDEENTDIASLKNIGNSLDNIRRFTKEDKRYDGIDYTDITKRLDELKKSYDELYKKMNERLLNEEGRQKEAFNSWLRDISSALKDIGEKEVKTIEELYEMIEKIKKDETLLKTVTDFFMVRMKDTENAYTKKFLDKLSSTDNVDSVINDIIGSNGISRAKPSYQKYLISLNIDDIDVSEFDTLEKEEIEAIKGMLIKAKEMKSHIILSSLVNSKKSLLDVTESIKKWLKTNIVLAPFIEQDVTIRTALVYLFNPHIEAMNLQGKGGTGKSKLVAKMISDIFRAEVGDDMVVAMGEGERANDIINISLFDKKSPSLLEFDANGMLKDETKLYDAIKDKKLVIIDEVGRLSNVKYKQLTDVFEKIQETNKEFKVLFTGDQQQLTGQTFPVMSTDNEFLGYSKKIIQLPVLTIMQRTGDSEVQRLQDKFLFAGNTDVFAEKMSFSHNHLNNVGVSHVSDPKSFDEDIKERFSVDDGRS
ncbi:hypothetical protein COY23_03200, partial [bacterium (Candidatus Torokbacteria) CG_4_10_14_0_2_um_filter_35_8]